MMQIIPRATCCTGLDNILDLCQSRSVPGKRWPQPEGPACCDVPLAYALLSAPACLAPVIHKQIYQCLVSSNQLDLDAQIIDLPLMFKSCNKFLRCTACSFNI